MVLLGFIQQAGADLLTPTNIILIVVTLSSLAVNFFQFHNKRTEVIHDTDVETIASYERAITRLKEDVALAEARMAAEKARAEGLAAELSSVKPELVALMAIDIHELLEFAKMKRRLAAQDRELEELNRELIEAHRPKQLIEGRKGGEA
jgi:hypothetical protein